jgi:hypothetical protein
MNRGRVGEERGGKETDGCPLTIRSDTSGGELLVIDKLWGYIFYTMRRGLNDG